MKLLTDAETLEEYFILSGPKLLSPQNGYYIAYVVQQNGVRGILIYGQGRKIAFLAIEDAIAASDFVNREVAQFLNFSHKK